MQQSHGWKARRRATIVLVSALFASAVPILSPVAVASADPATVEAAGTPAPATAILSPSGDTFVSAGAPTTNFSTADHIDTYGGTTLENDPYDAPVYGLLNFD